MNLISAKRATSQFSIPLYEKTLFVFYCILINSINFFRKSSELKYYLTKIACKRIAQTLLQFYLMVLIIIVFVMLSDYIRKGAAYINEQKTKISLQHTDRPLALNYLGSQYSKLVSITLNYCNLHSLKGIQQFQQLEELNIKFNDITQVAQLYRIKNKKAILKLEFSGNEIQYLGGALFINLIKVFPNLIEVNGRNYLSIIHHKRGKNHSMRKILAQSNNVQKQMIKTIRREKARNQEARRAFNGQIQQEGDTKKYIIQEETNEEQLFSSRQRFKYTPLPLEQNPKTSKKHYQCQYNSQEEDYAQSGLKENRNLNNISQERDISLGGLSNIPMTKSVRPSVISNSQPKNLQKNKGLEIFVLNQSLNNSHTNHNHYAQPTATFAMQRKKQNLGFDFKEKRKSKTYQNYSILIEQCQGQQNCQLRPTKRQTYGSIDSEEEVSLNFQDSQAEINLICNPIFLNQRQTLKIARHYYQKHVESKVFMALRNLPKKKNLPMRLHFQ